MIYCHYKHCTEYFLIATCQSKSSPQSNTFSLLITILMYHTACASLEILTLSFYLLGATSLNYLQVLQVSGIFLWYHFLHQRSRNPKYLTVLYRVWEIHMKLPKSKVSSSKYSTQVLYYRTLSSGLSLSSWSPTGFGHHSPPLLPAPLSSKK